MKSGPERWAEIAVPTVREPHVDFTDLLNRTRFARGRVRTHIERDVAKRHAAFARSSDEVLHEWE
ncbi:MAG: hypothetical protein LAO06_00685 [Acidobacteriia bacterium]|nr:hypothetical protein [Terriglobia bacterium]